MWRMFILIPSLLDVLLQKDASFFFFLQVLFIYLFSFSDAPCSMWDLSSLTRDQTHTPCIGRQSLNH